jgi:hypothetical protein
MFCNPLIDPSCAVGTVIKSAAGSVTGDVLSGIAQAINSGVGWVVANTATWWVRIPSPDLATEPAVTRIQQWLLPITAAVAVGGVIAAGLRMALTRRANPLLDVTGGLVTIAAASTLGTAAVTLLLKAGDAWSAWVLQVSTGGQFTQRLNQVLQLGGGAAAAVVLVFGLIAIVLSLVQAVLMLFRQAALLILAGVLPLAAAGSIAPMTRTWVRKVTAWMLALICYKPAAAAVYAAAFTMVGTGHSPRTALMGFMMMLLSVLMLPALMKFFTWTTGSIGSSGGGSGQFLGAATIGAIAFGAIRPSGAGPAQGQASHISSTLGPPPSGSGSDSPPSEPSSGPSSGDGLTSGGQPAAGSSGSASGRPAWPNTGPGSGRSSQGRTGSTADGPAGGAGTPTGSAEAGAASGSPAASSASGPGAASSSRAAAGAAAAGVGAAAVVAAEAAKGAAQAGHLAAGAMEPGDES